jgi:HAD superfamily hydrolase (TIGR01509 family)
MGTSCAILWDLDGVIVDSGDLHHRSFEHVLKDYGIEFPRSMFLKSFGRNNDSVLEMAIGRKPDQEMKEIVNIRKEEWYCQHIAGNLKLLPGALEWLKWFKANGIPQAIASSAPMENITLSLDEFKLGNYFDAVVSGNRIIGKPDPKVFLRAAAALQTDPSQCIVFEDSIAGMQGALAGGMRCITVATTHPVSEFADATIRLEKLTDISEKQMRELLGI